MFYYYIGYDEYQKISWVYRRRKDRNLNIYGTHLCKDGGWKNYYDSCDFRSSREAIAKLKEFYPKIRRANFTPDDPYMRYYTHKFAD